MTKLRCWPGCLAMVKAPFDEMDGRTLVCVALDPDATEPAWLYEGGPWTFVRGNRLIERMSFYDRFLVPLVPPPGVDDKVTLQYEPVAGDEVVYVPTPEEVT